MVVSDDLVLGDATSDYGWHHVVSLRRNSASMTPGGVGKALCGRLTRTLNFSGVYLWWHGETVCAKCKAAYKTATSG